MRDLGRRVLSGGRWPAVWLALVLLTAASALAAAEPAPAAVAELAAALPARPADFTPAAAVLCRQLAQRAENWFHESAETITPSAGAAGVAVVERLEQQRAEVDRLLERVFALRTQFASLPAGDTQRAALRSYLRIATDLIDLSGRARFVLADAVEAVASQVASSAELREKLLRSLVASRCDVGANVMSVLLFDPPDDAPAGTLRPTPAVRRLVLELIRASKQPDLVPLLASYLREGAPPAGLALLAAETICELGLPQVPRPGGPADAPSPIITAVQLHKIVGELNPARLAGDEVGRRETLLAWLDAARSRGLPEPKYRLGAAELRPGDWLLMRNPSPYNLFTDLSPGLFTHVGIVTTERGRDGIERMVIVDLPEKGTSVPATNVEVYVERTLHYVFLRHPDPLVADQMAEAARSIIGNEAQFDLNFRTDRLLTLRGQSLAGKKIHTYCAGLLLLCAQASSAPRSDFFPVAESAAGGRTPENLLKIGLSVGADFVSPTGALFSEKLHWVGRQATFYDPRRHVEEAIFDHFAANLERRPIHPASTDVLQAARLRAAEYSRRNPWLGRMLADAAGVNRDTDLVAAAKAATVVEMLDDIAYTASGDFTAAQTAFSVFRLADLRAEGYTDEDLRRFQQLRERHAPLFQAFTAGKLSQRSLRLALERYYIDQGKEGIEARFFSAPRVIASPAPTTGKGPFPGPRQPVGPLRRPR